MRIGSWGSLNQWSIVVAVGSVKVNGYNVEYKQSNAIIQYKH